MPFLLYQNPDDEGLAEWFLWVHGCSNPKRGRQHFTLPTTSQFKHHPRLTS